MPIMPSIFSQQEEQALEDKLLEIAQPQTKQAQATPADPNAIKALARKLADRLGLSSSVSMDKPTSLYMRDLQNLDSLISFLNVNGVKYADKFIVQPDYNKIPEAERAAYVPYKWSGGVEAMPMGSTVAIYKDGLVGYLKSIQQKANAAGDVDGQLLTTMIGKLIDSANTTLKTKIDHEALKAAPAERAAEPVLLYATALDSVNETLVVENPLVPGRDKGAIKVTPKDLKSKMDFDDFARQLKVSKGGKVFDYEVNTSETFFCDIINVLHARAVLYANRRGVYLDKAYLQMVTDLAGQYQCTLTITPGGAATPTPVAGQISPRVLTGLANLRPFNSQYINFQEITTFLDKYQTVKPSIAPWVKQVKDSIGEANRVLSVPNAPLQMDNLTTAQVKSWTKEPLPLMNYLYTIISVAGRIYLDFLTECRNVLGAQAAESVEQQITSGGPQQTNIGTILRVKDSLMNEIQGRR